MDGICGMEGNGPASGIVKKADLLLVSSDPIALDVVATNIIGFESMKLQFIIELLKRDINPFPIQQKGISKISIPFKKATNIANNTPPFLKAMMMKLAIRNIGFDNDKCKRCMICLNHCPVKTISYDKNKKIMKVNTKRCIHCFCCHELCPHDAIIFKRSVALSIYDKLQILFRRK
jgi:heterodisulfide reductase subunit A-like polyferredoxin